MSSDKVYTLDDMKKAFFAGAGCVTKRHWLKSIPMETDDFPKWIKKHDGLDSDYDVSLIRNAGKGNHLKSFYPIESQINER